MFFVQCVQRAWPMKFSGCTEFFSCLLFSLSDASEQIGSCATQFTFQRFNENTENQKMFSKKKKTKHYYFFFPFVFTSQIPNAIISIYLNIKISNKINILDIETPTPQKGKCLLLVLCLSSLVSQFQKQSHKHFRNENVHLLLYIKLCIPTKNSSE